jgi:surfeit locus 1 family protein
VVLTLFRPKYWAGHVAMLVCVAVAVGLGIWQLDAWQARRADAAKNISTTPPVALSSVMTGNSSFPGLSLGRPVSFKGSWLPGSTLFISDRYLHDRVGYWVVTPVRVNGSSSVMPVVRGWSAKPDATDPAGPVSVTGWLQASEADGPADPNPNDRILPMMRLASLVQYINADLYRGYVVARDVAGSGGATPPSLLSVSAAAVPPVSGFTALRNFLYAIEWWIFGAFALFVWARWCQDCLRPAKPEPGESNGEFDSPAVPADATAADFT